MTYTVHFIVRSLKRHVVEVEADMRARVERGVPFGLRPIELRGQRLRVKVGMMVEEAQRQFVQGGRIQLVGRWLVSLPLADEQVPPSLDDAELAASNDEGFRWMPHAHIVPKILYKYPVLREISGMTFRSTWDGAACLVEATALSTAATAERHKHLQDAGVIREAHADLDLARVGWSVPAIIGITAGNRTRRRC